MNVPRPDFVFFSISRNTINTWRLLIIHAKNAQLRSLISRGLRVISWVYT